MHHSNRPPGTHTHVSLLIAVAVFAIHGCDADGGCDYLTLFPHNNPIDTNFDGGMPALCGDGVKIAEEQCDDGNDVQGDGCDNDCRFSGQALTPPVGRETEWNYYPVEGARCRDGSGTGVHARLNPNSDNLMVFFAGGGACFNAVTCLANPYRYDPASWQGMNHGIFKDAPGGGTPMSPVGDWNIVWIPYCTGDVHLGDRENVEIPLVGGRHNFVGYRNVQLIIRRVLATLPEVNHLLVAGDSAGGFGASGNILQIARSIEPTRVSLLNDSAPIFRNEFFSPCLQQLWRNLWGFDRTVLRECGDNCDREGGYLMDALRFGLQELPDATGGIFCGADDPIMNAVVGYGNGLIPGHECVPVPHPDYGKFHRGLLALRRDVSELSDSVGTYFVHAPLRHTCISSDCFYTTEREGVTLVEWTERVLLNGEPLHIGTGSFVDWTVPPPNR